MHAILLTLGLTVTAAGLAMAGFGIPNNEFGTGNTLIQSGTIAIVGGLILIGLSAALRQLNRIAQALETRTAEPRVAGSSTAEASAPRRTLGGTAPRAAGPPVSEDRESALEGAPPASVPAEPPGRSFRGSRLEALAPIEPADQFPSQPQLEETRPRRPNIAALSRALGQPDPDQNPAEDATPSGIKLYAPPRSRRQPAEERGFDTAWPSRRSRDRAASVSEGAGAADETGAPPAESAAPDEAEPPAARALGPREPVALRPTRSPQAATILKSGVIEGMAYTLYSDGSIEAETPQGVMRFGSVDELRAYLSGNG